MPAFENEIRSPFGQTLLRSETPSDLAFKDAVIIRILRLLQENACLSKEDTERVQLVLDEAVKNSMMHGNRYQPDKKVSYHLYADDEKWAIVLGDEGEGMTKSRLPPPVKGEQDLRESGYGIMLMESIMNEVVFMGRGNMLLLARKRSKISNAEAAEAVESVSALTEAQAEETSYVIPASQMKDVPESLDFDESLLTAAPASAEQAPEAPKPAAAPTIDGAELVSENSILRTLRKDNAAILELLTKQISDFNLNQVRDQLMSGSKDKKLVIIDLRNVNYLSSVVLGALVNIYRDIRKRGATCRFSSPTETVREVLKITRLDSVLPVYSGIDEAIRGDKQ